VAGGKDHRRQRFVEREEERKKEKERKKKELSEPA
jgi:hypothetical protein